MEYQGRDAVFKVETDDDDDGRGEEDHRPIKEEDVKAEETDDEMDRRELNVRPDNILSSNIKDEDKDGEINTERFESNIHLPREDADEADNSTTTIIGDEHKEGEWRDGGNKSDCEEERGAAAYPPPAKRRAIIREGNNKEGSASEGGHPPKGRTNHSLSYLMGFVVRGYDSYKLMNGFRTLADFHSDHEIERHYGISLRSLRRYATENKEERLPFFSTVS